MTLAPEVALDFGGIAKGVAVDAALDALSALGIACAAVEAGGDLRVQGSPPDGRAWPVAIQLPDGFETVSLYGGALATSSPSRRHWRQGAVLRHHILDPRSGEPARTDLWSATVAAGRCARADVAAKTAFILGRDQADRFLARHNLAGLLVTADGRTYRTGPWQGPGAEVDG